jgi:hypothetical protein
MEEQLELQGSVETPNEKTIQDAEWCFQFFNNEPIVFAWQEEGAKPSPLVMQVQAEEGQGLVFKQNGMEFRIFAREISEESKREREQTKNKND